MDLDRMEARTQSASTPRTGISTDKPQRHLVNTRTRPSCNIAPISYHTVIHGKITQYCMGIIAFSACFVWLDTDQKPGASGHILTSGRRGTYHISEQQPAYSFCLTRSGSRATRYQLPIPTSEREGESTDLFFLGKSRVEQRRKLMTFCCETFDLSDCLVPSQHLPGLPAHSFGDDLTID